MTRDQALDVLRRATAGETFTHETMLEAYRLAMNDDLRAGIGLQPEPVTTVGTLPPAPAGCEWHRPAPGWVDLVRVAR